MRSKPTKKHLLPVFFVLFIILNEGERNKKRPRPVSVILCFLVGKREAAKGGERIRRTSAKNLPSEAPSLNFRVL